MSTDNTSAATAAPPAPVEKQSGGGLLSYWWSLLAAMADRAVCISALSIECALTAIRPSSWRKPVRMRFSFQIMFSGVEAVTFTAFAGLLIGMVTTTNAVRVLTLTGDLESLGAAVAILFVREGAPFFAMVISICASMSAITSEISTMRLSGEIDLLESQGVNSIQFIALPRAIGLAITSVGLSLIFATAAVIASYISIAITGRVLPGPFVTSIYKSITFADLLNLVGRSSIAAYISGIACYYEGLRIEGAAATKGPQAVTRAMLSAVAITLIVSTVFAIFSYSS